MGGFRVWGLRFRVSLQETNPCILLSGFEFPIEHLTKWGSYLMFGVGRVFNTSRKVSWTHEFGYVGLLRVATLG